MSRDETRLAVLENQMIEIQSKQRDHEERIRSTERNIWMAAGAIILANAALGFFVVYFPHH